MRVIPFEVGHLLLLEPHAEQMAEYQAMLPGAQVFEESPWKYTAIVDGKVMACGGVRLSREGVGFAWMCFSRGSREHLAQLTEVARNTLALCPLPRIETTVKASFKAGHRWMKRTGFELEAPTMRKFGPKGETYSLYARVK